MSTNVDLLNSNQTFTGVKTFNPSSGSVPFAVDATKNAVVSNLNADLLDGQHSSAFVTTSSDYGRSGVATDLYEGTSTLTSKYVNVSGPESVVSSSGTAFLGRASGSSASLMRGVQGYGDNSSTGSAYGGYFSTSYSGTGYHYGVYGVGSGFSSASTYGSYGFADNSSTGDAYAGYFVTSSSGTGDHIGVYGRGDGSSSAWTYGSFSVASNTSSGPALGGYFSTSSSGTGPHYGVYGVGRGSSSAYTYGSRGYAENTSTGPAYGGYFETSSSGSGWHYGVYGAGSGSSFFPTYGSYGYADNTSSGSAYGGYFSTSSSGTGTHYGVWVYELAGGSGYAVYAAGDMGASGTKSAVVRTSKGERLFYAQESPEVWFEDFGEGQLINGKAHIELDPLFLETVTINSLNPMKVFIQLTSGEPMNLVVNKGTTGFDLIASDNTSNSTFDYRIVAKRKGYETERMRETDVGKDDPNLYPELLAEIEKRHEEERARMEEEKKLREEEQKRMEEERLLMEKEQ